MDQLSHRRMTIRRRDFIVRAGQTTAAALAFPAVASALPTDTLEQRVRRLVEDVAPLRVWRFEQHSDTFEFFVGWEPQGEIIGQIPVHDESTVLVLSFVLPEQLQDKGVALRLYRGWGGKVRAAFPQREYTFLDG
jgi:hypothetical protein